MANLFFQPRQLSVITSICLSPSYSIEHTRQTHRPRNPSSLASAPTTRLMMTPSTTPLPREPPSPPQKFHNVDYAGKTRKDYLRIFKLIGDMTERKLKMQYLRISNINHPHEHCLTSIDLSPSQAE